MKITIELANKIDTINDKIVFYRDLFLAWDTENVEVDYMHMHGFSALLNEIKHDFEECIEIIKK